VLIPLYGHMILLWSLIQFFSASSSFSQTVVNDVTQLNPVVMSEVVAPTSVQEIQDLLKKSKGPISIGGGRYSMGGQTVVDQGVQIDMRSMNRVVHLDVLNKKITVQAGIRWRDIQDVIDPYDLSIKIMQTYSNFTVGGSLGVNVHGRYIGQGPLIRSVDSIRIVLADGSLIHASPIENSQIFFATIGGYGGIGVVVEATLQLADNEKVERVTQRVATKDYQRYFMTQIRDNPEILFHNGDIYPPQFDRVNAVSWKKTDKPLTIQDRLIPRNQKYWFQPRAVHVLNNIPFGRQLRASVLDPWMQRKEVVCWRNYEASYDVAELEAPNRDRNSFVLQEYFVPVSRFDEFVPKMRDVFKKHRVRVFNVSIRHALPDTGSLLAWASEEVFAFVVYYEQGTTDKAREKVGVWTREMIDQVLSVGGRYYLPYQIHATDQQFQKAYPRFDEFFTVKKTVDPENRFRNRLWDRYYR
jgi:FAD/FMN-containing dehydrogenase